MGAIATGFFAPQAFTIVGLFPGGIIGRAYDEQLALADAYSVPLSASILAGVLPPAGLTLAISGDGIHLRLYGTPLAPISISGVLPGYMIGYAYSARLQVLGLGSATVTAYSINAGAMPAWMSLSYDSVTNELVFSGTPV